jgi:hypothetical protein
MPHALSLRLSQVRMDSSAASSSESLGESCYSLVHSLPQPYAYVVPAPEFHILELDLDPLKDFYRTQLSRLVGWDVLKKEVLVNYFLDGVLM